MSSLLLNAALLGKNPKLPHLSQTHVLHPIFSFKPNKTRATNSKRPLGYNVANLSSVSNKTGAVVFNPLIRTEIATNRAIEADDLTGLDRDNRMC